MSNFLVFNSTDPGIAKESVPSAENFVDGTPSFKTWIQDSVGDGHIRSGFWEAGPGTFRVSRGASWEYCTLLSGVIELTEDGREPRRLIAGDTFTMRPGFTGTWRTIEAVRKLWVIVAV